MYTVALTAHICTWMLAHLLESDVARGTTDGMQEEGG